MFFTMIFFLGFTALHRAVFVNSVQIVNYLVSLGANVNMQVCFIFLLDLFLTVVCFAMPCIGKVVFRSKS